MKKLTWIFSLLVLLASTGLASAREVVDVNAGPRVVASVDFPGMNLVFGRPGIYCWYGGHYYSRVAWDRYRRFHQDRFDADRFHRNRFNDRDHRYQRDHDRF